jgi:acetyltransferase-like isoleucine patch superfamily enzyme
MRFSGINIWLSRLRSALGSGRFSIGEKAKCPLTARLRFKRGTVEIGRRATIHTGAIIDAQGGSIKIGDHFSLNPYSILYGSGGIQIGSFVRIAAHAVIVSFEHNYQDPEVPITWQGITRKPVIVEDDVWIGAGAKVLAGAHISRGCVIAANAVVKGKTEPFGIYAGVPARKVASRLPDLARS